MIPSDRAQKLDATILAPDATSAQVHKLVTDALQHGCYAVVVAPVWAGRVATMLRGSGVRVCAACSFPFGFSKSTVKAIEATAAVKDGADEIEVVPHLPNLINADFDATRAELLEIARAVRAARRDAVIKVVVESAMLINLGAERAERATESACRAIRESGGDAAVTSTGFQAAGGATAEAVSLLKKHGQGLLIKAAGGIDSRQTVESLRAAGAERIGITSMLVLE